jgi:uncharacterized membrane protein YGL010W
MSGRERAVSPLFRRQLTCYAAYHRDRVNCAMHCLGIPIIFLAVLILLALRPVPVGSLEVSIGTLLLLLPMTYWIAVDTGVGTAMLLPVALLAAGGEWIARSAATASVLSIATVIFMVGWVFQIVGHAVFERRKPAFVDDATQMLIGPMFVMAKILVWLGLRGDLAALLNGVDAGQFRRLPVRSMNDEDITPRP